MIHLHVHSKFSLRDSIVDFNELTDKLKSIGQDTIAITDHGNTLASVSFYQHCQKQGIKYIHGCEMYTCHDVNVKDKEEKNCHLVLLCKNEIGRQNLNTLISYAEHKDHFYKKPRIDRNILKQYSEGLVALSACLAGEIPQLLMSDKYEDARELALFYKNMFKEDFYLEIQSRKDKDQIELNKKIIQLANEINGELVVTTDAHYVEASDQQYQNSYAFYGKYKEDGESYIGCYIQSDNEIRNNLSTYVENELINVAIENTHVIADKCDVQIPLSAPIIPPLSTPDKYNSNYEWLDDICQHGWEDRVGFSSLPSEKQKEYKDRYNYEMDALDRMGFVNYILLVYTYANKAKRRGIARGSGGGSLVCYLSKIVDIDPIEHGLYFERFIDVGALDLLADGTITKKELKIPDLDLDFGEKDRDEIMQYLSEEYGVDNIASIGKFTYNHTRGTVRDMCKVLEPELGTTLEVADKIAKSFGEYELDDIDTFIQMHKKDKTFKIPEDAKVAIDYIKRYPKLFKYVRKLNNLPKSFGLHACGKIISTQALDYFMPSSYDKNGIRYLQGDMHDVDDLGLVKIDLLGLRTIDHEYDCLEMIEKDDSYISQKTLNYSDPKVLNIFRKGDTVGIFQMASRGMKQTLKKMDVKGIEDVSIANALFRPGAMAHIDSFCKRRKGEEEFEYLHPDLEPILNNTYGILVFQEQLIEVGRLAGMRNPDELRSATAKKKPKLLAKIQPELKNGLLSRGWSEEQFSQLWSDMLAFARYSFNKSHSSAYGIISMQTAKLKAYHPKEFFASLCNSYIGRGNYRKDAVEDIIKDINKYKIRINKFNFKHDHRRCNVFSEGINYGIPLIKDLNTQCGDELYIRKDTHYESFIDFVLDIHSSQIASNQLEVMIKLGFFDEFGNSCELLRIVDIANQFKYGNAKKLKKDKIAEVMQPLVEQYATDKNAKGQTLKSYTITDCYGLMLALERHIRSLNIPDFDLKAKMQFQQDYLGYINLSTGKDEDNLKYLIKKKFPVCRKKDGKQFGWNIQTQSIGTGKNVNFTVFNGKYKRCGEIKEGDIVQCFEYSKNWNNGKLYFNMDSYKVVS